MNREELRAKVEWEDGLASAVLDYGLTEQDGYETFGEAMRRDRALVWRIYHPIFLRLIRIICRAGASR